MEDGAAIVKAKRIGIEPNRFVEVSEGLRFVAEFAMAFTAIFERRPVMGIQPRSRVEVEDRQFVFAPVGIDEAACVADPEAVEFELDRLRIVGHGGIGVAGRPMSAAAPAVSVGVLGIGGQRFGEIIDRAIVLIALQKQIAAPDAILAAVVGINVDGLGEIGLGLLRIASSHMHPATQRDEIGAGAIEAQALVAIVQGIVVELLP